MVDVTQKPNQKRTARARGKVQLAPETLAKIRSGLLPKGDPFEVARIAGIQGAKNTSALIPLCHPLNLTQVDVQLELTEQGVEIQSEVACVGPTGAEMEALAREANLSDKEMKHMISEHKKTYGRYLARRASAR